MSTPTEEPRRPWYRSRLDPGVVGGIAAGVALYLVFIVGLGEIAIGLGIAAVALLILSLVRSVQALRTSRRRAVDRERDWYRN